MDLKSMKSHQSPATYERFLGIRTIFVWKKNIKYKGDAKMSTHHSKTGVLLVLILVHLSGKDDVLDIEIDSYIHSISAFVRLAQSEYALLTEIIPEHHQKKTFDSLIQVREQEIRLFYCGFALFLE